jgi:hypothetical protein
MILFNKFFGLNKALHYLFVLIYVFIFIIVAYQGPIILTDSPSYIEMFIIRLPAYALFLKLFQCIFHESYLFIVVIVQILIGFAGVFIFMNKLVRLDIIKGIPLFFLSLILLSPYFLFFKTANYILSEALAYPIYLIFLSCFINGIIKNSINSLLISVILAYLLLLVRSPFLFIIPVAILTIVYLIIRNQLYFKKLVLVIALFIITPIFANLTDMSYHKIVHDHFVKTPWTGIHLLASAIYVADSQDSVVFNNLEERIFFKKVYADLEKERLTLNQFSQSSPLNGYSYYASSFTRICNEITYNDGMEFFKNDDFNVQHIKLDKLTQSMSVKLIKDNFKNWLLLFIMNVIMGMGGKSIFLMYFVLVGFSFLPLIRSNDQLALIIIISVLLSITNVCVIALGQPSTISYRYTMYNDVMHYLILFMLLMRSFSLKNLFFNHD